MLNIAFELDFNAMEPTKAHTTDAGYDLYSLRRIALASSESACLDTGVHILLPEGYVGLILPRSSTAKDGLLVHTGVIDSGYTGSLKISVQNISNKSILIKRNARVAQLLILPIPQIQLVKGEVSSVITERGDNGFGSSGR